MNCLYKKPDQKFKIGDWFVLDLRGGLKKIKFRKVAKIKLGIKNISGLSDYWYVRKIIKINGNKIYYNVDEMIRIK